MRYMKKVNDDGNKVQENSGGDNLEFEEEPVENNEEIKDKKGKKTGRHGKKNK